MKILYLSFISEKYIGVHKKINAQIKSLEKVTNYKISECRIKGESLYLNEKKIGNYNCGEKMYQKVLRKFQEYFILKKLQDEKIYKDLKYVYIRRFGATTWLINYLKFLKKLNKKIILEVPTYPYDNEVLKEHYFVKQDKIWRKEYYRYVDKIVTYSDDKYIWNIPCINISNGVDLEEIKLVEKKIYKGINFISVSNCSFWHGIDRFLYSLLQYKKSDGKEKIKFHIVGEGSETAKLKKIVEDNIELHDIVIFHGFKLGKELDEIYNNSDIALGSLGNHRKGLLDGGGLKNREYCAKGIPFIKAGYDRFENCQFIYDVPNDESLLDIEKIIEWYKNLKVTPEEIRKYAEENLTWDKQMKKVIDSI